VGGTTEDRLFGAEGGGGLVVPRGGAGRDGDLGGVFFRIYLLPKGILLEKRENARAPAEHPVLLRLVWPRLVVEQQIIQSRWEGAKLSVVIVQGQADLFEMAGTLEALGRSADLLYGGDHQAD